MVMHTIRTFTRHTVGVLLALGLLYSCKGAKTEQETPPVQVLLTQAQSLSRLELATSELRTTLALDPRQDGFLGWKRLLGTRETKVEIVSQASAYCDLRLLTEQMIRQRNDSIIDLVLPSIEVTRELESMHRAVSKEADPMRSRLTENEIEELLQRQRTKVNKILDDALQQVRPQLLADARAAAESKLSEMMQQLGVRIRVTLSPSDEAESTRNPSFTPTSKTK